MLIQADARHIPLADESVHCVVTSPPYWGLRDYGTGSWQGGDPECQHVKAEIRTGLGLEKLGEQYRGGGHKQATVTKLQYGDQCAICGAVRSDAQLGLEPTPELYVQRMVQVFREVRRVLRKDGTLWLNLGSSYASGGRNPSQSLSSSRAPACGNDGKELQGWRSRGYAYSGLCDGCRAVLSSSRNADTDPQTPQYAWPPFPTGRDSGPADCASALQNASALSFQESTKPQSWQQLLAECSHCGNCGACLRVLGSSSRDARLCARRSAYSDGRVPPALTLAGRNVDKLLSSTAWQYLTTDCLKPKDDCAIPWLVALALRADGWYLRSDIVWAKKNCMPESVTDRPTKAHEFLFLLAKSANYYYDALAIAEPAAMDSGYARQRLNGTPNWSVGTSAARSMGSRSTGNEGLNKLWTDTNTRNRRTVWEIATQPYSGAHFATFPEALVEPCIAAGTSERGCCPRCGAPWERVTKPSAEYAKLLAVANDRGDWYPRNSTVNKREDGTKHGKLVGGIHPEYETTGWKAGCSCPPAEPVPCVVLDPFAGSGTTGEVAFQMGRRFILSDLKYHDLMQSRIPPMAFISGWNTHPTKETYAQTTIPSTTRT